MKCEEYVTLVEEHLGGELGAETACEISVHLDACATCRELYEEELREREIYSRYLRAVRPDTGMWSTLEVELKHERPAARVLQFHHRITKAVGGLRPNFAFPAAAAALLVICVALFVITSTQKNTGRHRNVPNTESSAHDAVASGVVERKIALPVPDANQESGEHRKPSITREGRVVPTSAENMRNTEEANEHALSRIADVRSAARRPARRTIRETTPGEIISDAERQHLAAIALLRRDILARQPALDAPQTTQYEATLATLDRTISDTRRAVRANPRDPIAAQRMLAAYGRKINLLEELASYQD
jgi:hypothetical protein